MSTRGATSNTEVCRAFAAQLPWYQRYASGIARLGGSVPVPVACCPIANTHEEILNGVPNPRGFVMSSTTCGGPTVTFIRGDCAACIFILREEGNDTVYTLLVRQLRPAVGRSNLLETVAGMIDLSAGTFALNAGAVGDRIRREVKEETGIDFDPAQFVDLSSWQQFEARTMRSFHPEDELTTPVQLSPGGCDEGCHLFAYSAVVPAGTLRSIHGSEAGAADENERTLIQIMPMNEALFVVKDAKFLSAYTLWQLYID